MKKNIGNVDRIIRALIGVILIAADLYLRSGILFIAGIFSIYEALSSWCFFYQIIGKNTCPISSKK